MDDIGINGQVMNNDIIDMDEYFEDSSDEEDIRNTIGNVPINWYDEYPHIGYNLDGKKILKPKRPDTLDHFLDRMENPDFYRTVFDKQTGQDVRLSDADLNFIKRVTDFRSADSDYDMYPSFPDLYSHEVEEMPLTGLLLPKRAFLPSKVERQKVRKLAKLVKFHKKQYLKRLRKQPQKYFDIWSSKQHEGPRIKHYIKPTKEALPGHELSYNPLPEFAMSEDAVKTLQSSVYEGDPSELLKDCYKSVLEIPNYTALVKERFTRLLDLYLCPRQEKKKIIGRAKDLLPDLPDRKDLRPFPTICDVTFKGHRSIIRSISLHSSGKFLASGSDDYSVKIWEVETGRCLRTFEVGGSVKFLVWNPNPKLFLLAIAVDKNVYLINPESYLIDKLIVQQTNAVFAKQPDQGDYIESDRTKSCVSWRPASTEEWKDGIRLVLEHVFNVKQIVWHKQGDYFASLMPENSHRSVVIHQLSRWRSNVPFNFKNILPQALAFHPSKPLFYVVSQSHIRVYNLQKQKLVKKVMSHCKWASSIALHPSGEHFIVGSYDRKVIWFEVECTKRPHILRYHHEAVRAIDFHRKYPLFASCSDEPKVVVTHATVYSDWLKDPSIVPVNELRGHSTFGKLYVLDVKWHHHEPYLFTAGADGTVKLWH